MSSRIPASRPAPQPKRKAAVAAARTKPLANRFEPWIGQGIASATTEQILRATRGKSALR